MDAIGRFKTKLKDATRAEYNIETGALQTF